MIDESVEMDDSITDTNSDTSSTNSIDISSLPDKFNSISVNEIIDVLDGKIKPHSSDFTSAVIEFVKYLKESNI